jgi:hypothetical protein
MLLRGIAGRDRHLVAGAAAILVSLLVTCCAFVIGAVVAEVRGRPGG